MYYYLFTLFSSDIIISNATIEHVGKTANQIKMISNIIKLSKKIKKYGIKSGDLLKAELFCNKLIIKNDSPIFIGSFEDFNKFLITTIDNFAFSFIVLI